MASADFFITNEQLKRIDDAVRSFGAKEVQKGQGLFRRGAVSDL
jgi:hypothetical protein